MTIRLQPYPMMDKPEIEALRNLLNERHPRRVLEWGSGGSTIYWPKLYPEVIWWSVEHNPVYAKALQGKTPPNVTLIQLDFPEYYELQADDIGMFDLIIVDGRERVKCLDIARDLLNPNGVAILHDAGRAKYAPVRNYYQHIIVLHPPKKAKDPRGLWMLTDPRKESR